MIILVCRFGDKFHVSCILIGLMHLKNRLKKNYFHEICNAQSAIVKTFFLVIRVPIASISWAQFTDHQQNDVHKPPYPNSSQC